MLNVLLTIWRNNSSYYPTSIDTEDYVAFLLVPLTFDKGSVSGDEQCYDVVIIDDDLVEDNEIFFVRLTSPEPALLGSTLSQATVTINPDPADGKIDKCRLFPASSIL